MSKLYLGRLAPLQERRKTHAGGFINDKEDIKKPCMQQGFFKCSIGRDYFRLALRREAKPMMPIPSIMEA